MQTISSSKLNEVLSVSFERELFEKDCLKSIDKKNVLLFNEKYIAMDVVTNWWCESLFVSFEKRVVSK